MKMRPLKSGMALAIACVLVILAAPAVGAEAGLVIAQYGGATYPWGNTPAAGGYSTVNGAWTKVGPATGAANPCPTCADDRANWRNNYQFPVGGNAAKSWDFAFWMSPPGRFPLGANAAGHQDLAGLQMEITATTTTNDTTVDLNGQTVNQVRVKWSKNGSWEGHNVGYASFEFAIMTKYGKTGGRCARD